MLKRMLVMAVGVGLSAWAFSSCNTNLNLPATTPPATLITLVTDVPYCGVLNFRATITGLGLTPKGGTSAYQVFGTPAARQPFYRVGFGKLRDFTTLLDVGSIPPGTYDTAIVTFSTPQIAVFDPTLSPPAHVMGASVSPLSPKVAINPPLVVASGGVGGLQIDFNLRQSLTFDSHGQVTQKMIPVLTVTPISPSPRGGFGEMDDVQGFATSVLNSSTGAGFLGGFGFETLSGTGPLVIANITNSTQFCGPATASNQACQPLALNQMLTGSFVALDGYFDVHGNLVAYSAEVEDQEIIENNRLAFLGSVMPNSIVRGADGNVTQFDLYVFEEEPDDEFSVPLDSIVQVNLSSSTIYQFSGRTTNFAGLSLNPSSIQEGQEIVVHGVFTKSATSSGSSAPPVIVAANKVFVKPQSHEGNFLSLVSAQADDKTGAFWLASCSTLFGGAPILVLTNGPGGVLTSPDKSVTYVQTSFVNLTGLSGLSPQPALLVKGLLFYNLAGGVVNGVTVPPGTLVLLARQVHQLS